MKQIYYDNPNVTTTSTLTLEALEYGMNIFEVQDASSFVVNDIILIEDVGHEYCEIRIINNINLNQIEIDEPIKFPHLHGIKITKLNYDKFRITKSDNILNPFNLLVEDTLKYEDKFNRIDYYDDSGSDNLYYRIYYYNSVTDTEILVATLHNQDNFSWMTKEKFMDMTKLDAKFTDYVEEALRFGVESLRDDIMFSRLLTTNDPDKEFILNVENYFLADINGDREIDKYDIEVYEFDAENNLATYINHKIVKVFVDAERPKIIFSEKVPSQGKQLYIRVNLAQVPYKNYRRSYEEINKLYAVNYLLSDKTNDNVKTGILSWTAGGTSVNKEIGTVKDVVEKNQALIRNILKDQLLKAYIGKTKLRTRYSSLNFRSSGGGFGTGTVHTPSGNIYRLR